MDIQSEQVRYLRPKEWYLVTGMTVFQAYRELKRGNLRGVKVGESYFIDASEITEYFERNGKRLTAA